MWRYELKKNTNKFLRYPWQKLSEDTRENRIPFELSADPFYSDANMSRLRESIRQIRDGEKKLTEHEIENK